MDSINSRNINLSPGRVVELKVPLKVPMSMGKGLTTKYLTIERRKGQYLLVRHIGYWPLPSKPYWHQEIKRENLAGMAVRSWDSEDSFFLEFAPDLGMYEYDRVVDLEVVKIENGVVFTYSVHRGDPQLAVQVNEIFLSHWFLNYRNHYKRVKGRRKISTLMKQRGGFLFPVFDVLCRKEVRGNWKLTKGTIYRVLGISFGEEGREYLVKDDSGLFIRPTARIFSRITN